MPLGGRLRFKWRAGRAHRAVYVAGEPGLALRRSGGRGWEPAARAPGNELKWVSWNYAEWPPVCLVCCAGVSGGSPDPVGSLRGCCVQ